MKKENIVVGNVKFLRYNWGKTAFRQGIKKNEYRGGKYHRNELVLGGGNGTLVTMEQASHLVLTVQIDNKDHEVWIESVFRFLLEVKYLTARIRRKIQEKIPTQVELVQKMGHGGVPYYSLSNNSARDWAREVKPLL